MPQGPRGEKRPADVIGNDVKVMRIATGEEMEEIPDSANNAAAELGRRGGKARAEKLSAEERSKIARQAAGGAGHAAHKGAIRSSRNRTRIPGTYHETTGRRRFATTAFTGHAQRAAVHCLSGPRHR
jgi:hypothetical protein